MFPDSYRRSLAKLLSYLTTYMKVELPKGKTADMKVLNRNMAVFFKDLFYIYDRGLVLDMVRFVMADTCTSLCWVVVGCILTILRLTDSNVPCGDNR